MILHVHDSDERWIGAARVALLTACEGRQQVHLCLSGGSTPRPLYEDLAQSEDFRALLSARELHLWVGDEREASEESGLRNSEMIASCFRGLPLAIHLWPPEPREEAVHAYEAELWSARGRADPEEPLFDLVLLGMGEDGHSAGLFSAGDLVPSLGNLVRLTEAPTEPKRRVTLTSDALLSSKKIIVFLKGSSKVRRLMANLFGEAHDPIGVFLRDSTEVIARL